MPTWSVAIAGAGPAGLAAALCLHRDGHRVTVFERFSAPQPIGAGLMLQPTGLAVLRELGLADKVLARGRRIDRMFGRVLPSRRVVLDLHYRTLASGRIRPRGASRNAVHAAVRCGARKLDRDRNRPHRDRRRAGLGRATSAGVRRWPQSAPFDLVVDALGMRSPLAPIYGGGARHDLAYGALWTTLPWPRGHFDEHTLEQRYRRASVMIGVLPIGRRTEAGPQETAFFWSLKPADYDAWRAAGLDAWKERALELWPETAVLLEQITSPDQFTLARYAHYTVMRPIAAAFAAIGDSAHAASPQLGQGANMALLDAYALALALRGSADLAEALCDLRGIAALAHPVLSVAERHVHAVLSIGQRGVAAASGLDRRAGDAAAVDPRLRRGDGRRHHSRSAPDIGAEPGIRREAGVVTTVLILGGYGTFGGRLAHLLADEPRLRLLIAGRSRDKAEQFCAAFPGPATVVPVAFDRDGDVEAQLRDAAPDIVVDASGPFQAYGDAYRVVRACLALGIDYLDLADGSDFVKGIAQFDAEAKARGVFILSGVSSFPVLTAAVVRHLSAGMTRVDTVTGGIAPSPYAGVGLNVIRAIASYAGKPIETGPGGRRYAMIDARRYTIAPPGGCRSIRSASRWSTCPTCRRCLSCGRA